MNTCAVHLALTLLAFVVPAGSQQSGERRLAGRVSEVRLRSSVRDLVRLGNRMGGTPSGDASAQYVASTFQSYGLNVRITEGPPVPTFMHTRWTLKVVEPRSLRSIAAYEWPAGFSPALPLDTFEIKSMVGLLSGKAAEVNTMILMREMPDADLFERFAEQGTGCVLVADSVNAPSYEDSGLIHSLPGETEDTYLPVFSVSRRFARTVESALERGLVVRVVAGLLTSRGTGRPVTVEGILEGSTDTSVIVCAHGDADSGGPGADDNASGVAGVLELARVISSGIRGNILPPPRYGIRFIVWGAEIESTREYIRAHADSIDRIRLVLNFDEIGTGAERNCLYFEGNDRPINQPVLRIMQDIAEEYVGRPGFWSEATTNPSQGGTDSYVFEPASLRRLGVSDVEIPAITIFTAAWNMPKKIPQTPGWSTRAWKGNPDTVIVDYSRYYHSSRDLPALTTEREPFNMVWAVKAALISLIRIAWTSP
ncbi:MAG: hypothetical protein A3H45_05050 [Ignavibacteria bacterium RIFCSPLOWO2_02_FULL_55_14]|nr:MAG: hypothetical protein A3H45_05050 [Ignavibacteria bacterium RIFCSPLOWO2_02_FULL_55_14]